MIIFSSKSLTRSRRRRKPSGSLVGHVLPPGLRLVVHPTAFSRSWHMFATTGGFTEQLRNLRFLSQRQGFRLDLHHDSRLPYRTAIH